MTWQFARAAGSSVMYESPRAETNVYPPTAAGMPMTDTTSTGSRRFKLHPAEFGNPALSAATCRATATRQFAVTLRAVVRLIHRSPVPISRTQPPAPRLATVMVSDSPVDQITE
jgi:hypothetical protein